MNGRNIFLTTITWIGLLWMPQATFAQSDGVRLKWKFAEGQRTLLELSQQQTLEMNILGNKNTTTSTTKSWMSWNVDEIDSDGIVKLKSKINRMTMDTKTPIGNMSVDTAIAADAPGQDATIGAKIRPLIDVEIEQRINASGKMIDVSMPDKLTDVVGAGSKQMLEQISKNAMLEFPADPLRIGDQWSNSFETPSPVGVMNVTNTYTYKGVAAIKGKDLHHINLEIKMRFLKGDGNVTIDITEQSTLGNLYFDAEKGRLDHSDVEQAVKMSVNVQGQTIEQSIKNSMKVVFSDIEKP